MDTFGPEKALYSVEPCTKYLTFGYWIYMVPQYRPESVLMLGYAGGTVAGLIRKLYDDVPITAVDVAFPGDNKYGVDRVTCDAELFVASEKRKWDCVILDCYDGYKAPAFVFEPFFAENLARITERYLIINHISTPGVWHFAKRFEQVDVISVKTNNIYYFKKHGVELPLKS